MLRAYIEFVVHDAYEHIVGVLVGRVAYLEVRGLLEDYVEVRICRGLQLSETKMPIASAKVQWLLDSQVEIRLCQTRQASFFYVVGYHLAQVPYVRRADQIVERRD